MGKRLHFCKMCRTVVFLFSCFAEKLKLDYPPPPAPSLKSNLATVSSESNPHPLNLLSIIDKRAIVNDSEQAGTTQKMTTESVLNINWICK